MSRYEKYVYTRISNILRIGPLKTYFQKKICERTSHFVISVELSVT